MKKHLKTLAFLLMALPVIALGGGIIYNMFCLEPVGTILVSSLVAGTVLYFTLPE